MFLVWPLVSRFRGAVASLCWSFVSLACTARVEDRRWLRVHLANVLRHGVK